MIDVTVVLFTAPLRTTKDAQRARRHELYQRCRPISWRCPTCGKDDHGAPVSAKGAVSTASHDGVAVLAFTSTQCRLGVDITPVQPPVEFARTPNFAEEWATREAIGKAAGVGIVAEPAADVQWSIRRVELPGYDEYCVIVACDDALGDVTVMPMD